MPQRPITSTSTTELVARDSMRYKTYNNVVETITCIANNHLMINGVSTGDIWEIDLEKNTFYPYFHVNPVSVVAGENTLTMNYQLFIMDLVEPHQSNEQQVLSDTLQIMIDVITQFRNGEKLRSYNQTHGTDIRYWTEGDFSMEPFVERFSNSVTGWVTDLPVIVEHNMNTCNTAFDNTDDCTQ